MNMDETFNKVLENKYSLDDLRRKAHKINFSLSKEKFSPREIEIIGYYIHRIAASYLSYAVHKELSEAEESGDMQFKKIDQHSEQI